MAKNRYKIRPYLFFLIDNQLVKNKYRSRIFNKNFIDLYYEPGSAALREVNYNK